MNIISKVWNAIAPDTSAAPTATTAAAAAPVSENGYRIGEPAQDLDKFEQTYSRPPYLHGSYRAGKFFGRLEVPVSVKTVQAVAKRAGILLNASEKAELEQNRAEENKLHERMGTLGFLASTTLWQQRQAEAAAKIRAGDKDVNIPTRQQILDQICGERAAIHGLFRQSSARNYAILKLACERFGRIARAMVTERDQQERAAHADLHGDGVPFEPSHYLRGLCYIALALAEAPTRNFELCGNLPAPSTDKLLELFIPPSITTVQPSPAQSAEVRAQVEPTTPKVDEATAARHKSAVAEKNAMVEKIKSDIQQVNAESELARVKAGLEKDARNAALKQKILDDAAAAKTQTK